MQAVRSARGVSHFRVFKRAFSTIVEIVGNVVVCTLVAWFASYIWSLGCAFVGSSVKTQTRVSFLAGALATSHVISVVMAVITQTFVLCSVHAASGHAHPPSMMFYALRLAVESRTMVVVTLLLYVALPYALSLAPATVQACKLEFYITCLIGHFFNTTVGISTRRIIKENIARAQQAATSREQPCEPESPASALQLQRRSSRARCARRPISSVVLARARWSIRYAKVYARMFTVDLSLITTGLYVHLAIHFRVLADSTGLFLFVVGSLALKILSQEGAKLVLLRKNVSDIRAMCVAVGLPPIIIDTQVRVVLQYAQSTTATAFGILGLGGIEIAMRVGKLLWLKAQIRRRTKVHLTSVAPQPAGDDNDRKLGQKRPTPVRVNMVTSWERRVWKMYTAELYTDMSAEYIAIGCSTCFLYFFGTHPKYMLSRTLSAVASDSTATDAAVDYASVSDWHSVLRSLGGQLAVEMLVDFLSAVVEINAGTDFEQLSAYRGFVLAFLAHAAIASTQISGIMYLLESV